MFADTTGLDFDVSPTQWFSRYSSKGFKLWSGSPAGKISACLSEMAHGLFRLMQTARLMVLLCKKSTPYNLNTTIWGIWQFQPGSMFVLLSLIGRTTMKDNRLGFKVSYLLVLTSCALAL